jgi:endoglucanase
MKFSHLLFILALSIFPFIGYAQTPVAVHGQLSIDGNKLKDQHGNDYQLRGMSLFWSNWQGKFYNYDAIKWLRDDWHINVIRAAMGVSPEDNSGYLGNPEMEKQKVITVIEAAIDLGIYVIVDWHSHHGENETAEAQAFFAEIASTYGHYPNIIYETYNEPVTDWGTIKSYHESVVSSIRTHDSNNVIILGTAFYSQNIEEATNNPVSGTNLCYALHYYAATHTFWNSVQSVSNKGFYVFVSEFGTCDASGDGSINVGNSNTWWDVLDQYGVSWCNWAVSDVDEAASIVKPGSSIYGGWSASDLTENGTLVRNKLRSYATDPVPTDIPPYITANPKDQSVPFESAASFTVEVAGPGPMSYQWYFNNQAISGANAATYSIASVTETETGNYYCEIQNSYGTTTSKTVSLNVRYRSTFYSEPIAIPGKIEFEDYDNGGQNIGYSDASFGNSGGEYREDDVDIEAIQNMSGEYAVGFTDNGEWLAYTVNVGWTDEYEIDVFYASLDGGGTFSIELDEQTIVPSTNLPSTGGWFTYNKITINAQLTQGEHILKFNIENAGFNINYMEYKSTTPPETEPIITTQPKNTVTTLGKSTSIFVSATGANPLSYQWYKDNTAIPNATNDTYSITIVDEDDAGDYHVVVTNYLGTITSSSATLTVNNSAAYGGIPVSLPGRVLAKNFDEGGEGIAYHDTSPDNEAITNTGDQAHFYRDEGVDTESTTDENTGHSVGYIVAGEWMEYSVMVAYSGTYTVGFRVASGSNSGVASLALNVDGQPAVSTLSIPNTGGWDAWTTLEEEIELTAGLHILRLKANQGDWNVNYMDFSIETQTSQINLTQGWNLISFNVLPTDNSISSVFANADIRIIKNNEGFWMPTQAEQFNSLQNITLGEAYLVYTNTNTSVTIEGTTNETLSKTLHQGWNLVGVPTTNSRTISTQISGTEIQTIKNFDGFFDVSGGTNSISEFIPNKGYYIYANGTTTINW